MMGSQKAGDVLVQSAFTLALVSHSINSIPASTGPDFGGPTRLGSWLCHLLVCVTLGKLRNFLEPQFPCPLDEEVYMNPTR